MEAVSETPVHGPPRAAWREEDGLGCGWEFVQAASKRLRARPAEEAMPGAHLHLKLWSLRKVTQASFGLK